MKNLTAANNSASSFLTLIPLLVVLGSLMLMMSMLLLIMIMMMMAVATTTSTTWCTVDAFQYHPNPQLPRNLVLIDRHHHHHHRHHYYHRHHRHHNTFSSSSKLLSSSSTTTGATERGRGGSSSSTTPATPAASTDDDDPQVKLLLKNVRKSQLQDFCRQFQLSTTGTKEELLDRLQSYGRREIETQKRRELERVAKVEGQDGDADEATNNPKERHEIVGSGDNNGYGGEEDEDEFVIYFPLPTTAATTSTTTNKDDNINNNQNNSNTVTAATESSESEDEEPPTAAAASSSEEEENPPDVLQSNKKKKSGNGYISSNNVITAPPPPPTSTNEDGFDDVDGATGIGEENGERTVTIYSTKDQNDLTGIAAAQPGGGAMGLGAADPSSMGGLGDSQQPQPWDMQQPKTTTATEKEIEHAKEVIIELVRTFLSTTGAPAYSSSSFFDDDDYGDDLFLQDEEGEERDMVVRLPKNQQSDQQPQGEFVGFNPANVPTDLLTSSSRALLRVGRDSSDDDVLEDVLRQFEMQAIGYDGAAGDDTTKGGGHYREITKVRAFLLGYRRAQLRKQARKTTTLLLDKLVSEGIEGLDLALSSMTRGGGAGVDASAGDGIDNDDESYCWELNDSLLDFLNDAIRQQEKKIVIEQEKRKRLAAMSTSTTENGSSNSRQQEEADMLDSLWNVETQDDGQRIETIDPNDPKVLKVLEQERQQLNDTDFTTSTIAESPSEKLLLLLKLLRERLKAEAAFNPGTDEKGRNLRLLAYCLQVGDDKRSQEKLIMKEIGNSLDRLDSFLELVASSIEYGESTTHQLQPTTSKATKRPLDVRRLKQVHGLVQDLSSRQRKKAQHFGGM